MKTIFKRVLLKFSGEAIKGENSIFDREKIESFAKQIVSLNKSGLEIGIVVGGGNIYRGARDEFAHCIDRELSDLIGIQSTVQNAIALKAIFDKLSLSSEIFGTHVLPNVKIFEKEAALNYLKARKILIFCGGTGHPYFSTDSAAALRAKQIGAEVLLKGTKVDGVFDKDPVKFPNAKKFDKLSYNEALLNNLNVMDGTAFAFCMEHQIPIFVFNLFKEDAIVKSCSDKNFAGTWVK